MRFFLGKENNLDEIHADCTEIILTDPAKLFQLCTFLETNETIKIFIFIGLVGFKEGWAIAKVFAINRTIESFYVNALPRDCYEDKRAQTIARELGTKHILSHFSPIVFLSNQTGNEGAKAIAEALKMNCTIKELVLSLNLIGDEGAKAIAEALKSNQTVKTLELDDNLITTEGAKAIADALRVNCTIKRFCLRGNPPIASVGTEIVEALKINCTITELDLDYSTIGDVQFSEAIDCLEINFAIANVIEPTNIYTKCKTMALALASKVPIYQLLEIFELYLILEVVKATKGLSGIKNNSVLKYLEKSGSEKRLLSIMEKIIKLQ